MQQLVMDVLKATFKGAYDSIYGMKCIFYLDREMNERMKSRLSPASAKTPIRRRDSENAKDALLAPTRSLKKHEESQVLKRTFQCSVLNGGIFLCSILLFDFFLVPVLKMFIEYFEMGDGFTWTAASTVVNYFFRAIWVMPIFFLSKVINCLWFQDIADSAFRYSRGRPKVDQSISFMLADSLISIVIQILFLVQAMLVELIPLYFVGKILSLVHMAMLYSLYTFEYKWCNMGWDLDRRLTFIEINWPYFIGFGLPLAVLTQIASSYWINGCIFSILFPLFIISGNEASPSVQLGIYPLRLFSCIVTLTNAFIDMCLGNKTAPTVTRAPSRAPSTPRHVPQNSHRR